MKNTEKHIGGKVFCEDLLFAQFPSYCKEFPKYNPTCLCLVNCRSSQAVYIFMKRFHRHVIIKKIYLSYQYHVYETIPS
jgi:hypothetical protein